MLNLDLIDIVFLSTDLDAYIKRTEQVLIELDISAIEKYVIIILLLLYT